MNKDKAANRMITEMINNIRIYRNRRVKKHGT